MDAKKSIISFYKPFHLYLWKLSRKQTLKNKKQSLLTELFLCVDCYMWTDRDMLALCTWVSGFAIRILAKVLALFEQGHWNVKDECYSSFI